MAASIEQSLRTTKILFFSYYALPQLSLALSTGPKTSMKELLFFFCMPTLDMFGFCWFLEDSLYSVVQLIAR